MKDVKSFVGVLGVMAALSLSALADPVDGEFSHGQASGDTGWAGNGSYNAFKMGGWKEGVDPSGGGNATFSVAASIKPNSAVEIGNVYALQNLTLTDNAMKLVGSPSVVEVANGKTLTLQTGTLTGTGANALRLQSALGYGEGAYEIYKPFTNFAAVEVQGGTQNLRCTDAGGVALTDINVKFGGPSLSAVLNGSAAGADCSASIACGAGAKFTFVPGFGRLRVARSTNAAKATLNVGPIVREGRAIAQLEGSTAGEQSLGVSDFIKTSGTDALGIANGIVAPWLVIYGHGDHAYNLDFAAYSDAKGFVPATECYEDSIDAGETAVVNLTGNQTINGDKHVHALRFTTTDTSGFGSLAINGQLRVGDGVNPAGVIFNYSNKSGNSSGLKFEGTGALDFGESEGIVHLSVRDADARRYFYLNAPIKGEKSVTFSSAYMSSAARGPIVQIGSANNLQWKGDLVLRGVRWNGSSQEVMPFAHVYADGRGVTRSSQICLGAGKTYTNAFHIAGNGFQNSTDKEGVLNLGGGNAASLTGSVELMENSTFYGPFVFDCAISGRGGALICGDAAASQIFRRANTYFGSTYVRDVALVLEPNGTFGSGKVTVAAAGKINFRDGTRTVSNSISGDGEVSLTNERLTLGGKNAFAKLVFDSASQAAMAGASTLSLAATTTVKSVTGRGTVAAGTLVVANDADGEFASDLAVSAKLVKNGKGTLSTHADLSGRVEVNRGTLRVQKKLSAPYADSLVLWLDASDPATVKANAQGVVTNWTSKAGNVAFTTAAGLQAYDRGPSVDADGWNGRPVVHFDAATSNRLVSTAEVAPRTIFFVERANTDKMVSCAGLFGRNGYDRDGIRAVTYEAAYNKWSWNDGGESPSYANFPTAGYIVNGIDVGVKKALIASGEVEILTAVKSDTYTASDRSLSFTAGLGCYCDTGANRYLDGDIAEVVAYDRVLTDGERKAVENYLSSKWRSGALHDLPTAKLHEIVLAGEGVLDLAGNDLSVDSLSGEGMVTNSSDKVATLAVGSSGFSGKVGGKVSVVTSGGQMRAALGNETTLTFADDGTVAAYDFTPSTDGLVWWMDASDASTVATNAEGRVTSWSSKGGAAISFVPWKAAAAPFYSDTFLLDGNKRAIWFDGNGGQRLSASNEAQPLTTFLVFRATAAGVAKGTSCGIYGYAGVDCGLRYWTNLGIQYCSTCSPFSDLDDVYANGQKLSFTTYGTSGSSYFTADKTWLVDCVAAAGRSQPSKTFCFGTYRNSDENKAMIGWICESIAYNRRLTEAERLAVENYLMNKWCRSDEIPSRNTVLGGALCVTDGAEVTVAPGTVANVAAGAGTVNGDVTVANPFVVTADAATGAVPCLTVNGTATIATGTELQVENAARLAKNWASVISATTLEGAFAAISTDDPKPSHASRYQFKCDATRAQVGRFGGLFLVVK